MTSTGTIFQRKLTLTSYRRLHTLLLRYLWFFPAIFFCQLWLDPRGDVAIQSGLYAIYPFHSDACYYHEIVCRGK